MLKQTALWHGSSFSKHLSHRLKAEHQCMKPSLLQASQTALLERQSPHSVVWHTSLTVKPSLPCRQFKHCCNSLSLCTWHCRVERPSPSEPTKSFPTINDVLLSRVVMAIISTWVTNFFAKCSWGMFLFSCT